MKGQMFIQFLILHPQLVIHISWLWWERHSVPCLPWRHVTDFYHSEFWTTCACPKKRAALNLFTALKYFLSFRIFEQHALALKTEFALKFFTVLNIFFTIHRIFEQFVLALKNRACPEFTVLNIYFLSFRILNYLRLPWKTECALNFSLYWNTFYLSGFLSNLCLPWKQSLPWERVYWHKIKQFHAKIKLRRWDTEKNLQNRLSRRASLESFINFYRGLKLMAELVRIS